MRFAVFGFLAAFVPYASAFYLPGVTPHNFEDKEEVKLKVNKLTSAHSVISYSFYDAPYCTPSKVVSTIENLGETLRGDRIQSSLYTLRMKEPQTAAFLCSKTLSDKDAKRFSELVKLHYRTHAIVDNLPAATKFSVKNTKTGEESFIYERGFAMGFVGDSSANPRSKDGAVYLFNHLSLHVLYHPMAPRAGEPAGSRIVGFEVTPYSIRHANAAPGTETVTSANLANPGIAPKLTSPRSARDPYEYQAVAAGERVTFSYDVTWEASEIRWASRWDMYLRMQDPQIHWFSIVNSMLIILLLSGMVAMILVRVLHRDFARYNQLETAEEAREESGWKLVHGDVFRPPRHPSLLSVVVGTGVQLNLMALATIVFAALGFLSPANRGALIGTALMLFDLFSVAAGYFSARFFKLFKGVAWRANTLRTTFLFPGTTFVSFLALNFVIGGEKSSGAAPFSTVLTLVVLWFGLSLPLVFLGALLGFKKPEYEVPVRTNVIPRQIPEPPAYLGFAAVSLIGGILPFGAILIELYFILSSLWQGQTYYMFGFLLLVYSILVVTCAEISIVFAYFTLCGEDYRWAWRSVFTAGSSAFYLFIYSLNYLSHLEFGRTVDIILYVGYMGMISFGFFLLTGSIGFLSTFLFIRKIYGSIKVD